MITTIIKGRQWLSVNSPRVHVSSCTSTVFGLHSRIYVCSSRLWALLSSAFVSLCCSRDVTCVCVRARTCPCAYVCLWSLNLLHLCSVKCIYMKRRLTFLFLLKPRRPDILLTVAGDILALVPQEDYITPLLSPLISLSNILFIPPLLCPIPFLLFNASPLFPTVVITPALRHWDGNKSTLGSHGSDTFWWDRIGEEMSRAKQELREAKFQRWCLWAFGAPSETYRKKTGDKTLSKKGKRSGLVHSSFLEMSSTLFWFFFGLALISGSCDGG